MDDLELLADLHRRNERQGPGGEAETLLALRLAGLDSGATLRIADIGCGAGASALLLARHLDARVTAVDFLPAFVDELRARAVAAGVADRVEPVQASMDHLPFERGTFDAIWSEGAVYNIGFERGVREWRRFLKPGGILAVTEITWLTDERPAELQAHWEAVYPEIDTASMKIRALERSGYTPVGYFVLPERCWFDNYYGPVEAGFTQFLDRHGHGAAARALVEAEREEIALYGKYRAYVGYGFYIAKLGAC